MMGAATSSGLGDADAPANPFLLYATWVSYLFEAPASRRRPQNVSPSRPEDDGIGCPLGGQHARIRLQAQKPCCDLGLLLQPFVMLCAPSCWAALCSSGFEYGLYECQPGQGMTFEG